MNNKSSIRYVAVGDSYTCGEGIESTDTWPVILTHHLQEEGFPIALVANPSVTGWTTQDALEKELPIYVESKPSFTTLLIGVNDWVQEIPKETFQERLRTLLTRMQEPLEKKNNIILITIPDFSCAPMGEKYGKGRNIAEGITEFNEIIKEEGARRDLAVIDIFPLTQKMRNNPSLIAPDKLHPSKEEYLLWEHLLFPVAKRLLSE